MTTDRVCEKLQALWKRTCSKLSTSGSIAIRCQSHLHSMCGKHGCYTSWWYNSVQPCWLCSSLHLLNQGVLGTTIVSTCLTNTGPSSSPE